MRKTSHKKKGAEVLQRQLPEEVCEEEWGQALPVNMHDKVALCRETFL